MVRDRDAQRDDHAVTRFSLGRLAVHLPEITSVHGATIRARTSRGPETGIGPTSAHPTDACVRMLTLTANSRRLHQRVTMISHRMLTTGGLTLTADAGGKG